MPYKHFRPLPGRYGSMPVAIQSAVIGTGGTAVGATATTNYSFGGYPQKAWIEAFAVSAQVVAAGGAAITVQIFKRDVSAGADVALTGAVSLTSSFLTAVNRAFVIPVTATSDADRLLDTGDTLIARVVAAGTVTTQPVQGIVAAELLVVN